LPQATRLNEVNAQTKELLSGAVLKSIVDLIPDDWLHWEDTDETPEQIREIYFKFLSTRLAHSDIFLKQAQDARTAAI